MRFGLIGTAANDFDAFHRGFAVLRANGAQRCVYLGADDFSERFVEARYNKLWGTADADTAFADKLASCAKTATAEDLESMLATDTEAAELRALDAVPHE